MRLPFLLVIALAPSGCAMRQRGFSPEPARADAAFTPFTAVAAGADGSCAIRQDATLWCWGHNARKGLGLGDETRIVRPLQVGPLAGVTAVAPGSDHTCALSADHSLYCIGRNTKGQLGNGLALSSDLFVGVPGKWRSVAVAEGATCGVKDDGSLWCWGQPDKAEKSQKAALAPARVGDASDWTAVDSTFAGRKTDGSAATFGTAVRPKTDLHCAVRPDHTLWCWGQDLIVGPNTEAAYTEANAFQMSPDADWASVSVGAEHACALRRNGRAYCWGANSYGQLGTGRGPESVTFERWPAPVAMP